MRVRAAIILSVCLLSTLYLFNNIEKAGTRNRLHSFKSYHFTKDLNTKALNLKRPFILDVEKNTNGKYTHKIELSISNQNLLRDCSEVSLEFATYKKDISFNTANLTIAYLDNGQSHSFLLKSLGKTILDNHFLSFKKTSVQPITNKETNKAVLEIETDEVCKIAVWGEASEKYDTTTVFFKTLNDPAGKYRFANMYGGIQYEKNITNYKKAELICYVWGLSGEYAKILGIILLLSILLFSILNIGVINTL